jgi:Restriction endonuclease fold toxin 9
MHRAYTPFGKVGTRNGVTIEKEFTIKGYGRADAVRIDTKNKVIEIRELKPNNERSIKAGHEQLKRYKEGLSKMKIYKDYTIKTGLDTY